MPSVPPEPPDLVIRLRQQLILAQVRIMELEDTRDGLVPRLAELEQLLQAAQSLADRKIDEAAHSAKVLAETQARSEQLSQLHLRIAGELSAVTAMLDQRDARVRQLEDALRQAESELQAIKSSRSWRWTAWLRKPGGQP